MNDEENARYEIARDKIEAMSENEKVEKMMALQDELFLLANSFAGDETGPAAVLLHESCNCILRSKKWLNGTLDRIVFDSASLNMFGGLKRYELSHPRKNYV